MGLNCTVVIIELAVIGMGMLAFGAFEVIDAVRYSVARPQSAAQRRARLGNL
ncbi:hypothetical protein [Acuticoccus mangrovi]|uniref:Uncharacterized protein n=1 Tax=Acuticoccus mangrovi TaxID=2796142 RepID=A0A934MED9_9HYPH|nr:hypothetical protein [Acuticoccus mangrovi]MBJ3774283.1 hypothetical protein [Acuticoccus mangrovi]